MTFCIFLSFFIIYIEKVLNFYRGNAHCSIEKLEIRNFYSAMENLTQKTRCRKSHVTVPFTVMGCVQEVLLQPTHGRTGQQALQPQVHFLFFCVFCITCLVCLFLADFSENFYLKFLKLYRSRILVRFPGIILIVLRLDVLYGFLKTYRMGFLFSIRFSSLFPLQCKVTLL